MDIQFSFNQIEVDIGVEPSGKVALWNCSMEKRPRAKESKWYPLVEVQCAGLNHNNHHGCKHTLTSPASELIYEGHRFERNAQGDLFLLTQSSRQVRVTTRWQFFDGVRALRADTTVENLQDDELTLQYVTSFALTGLGHGEDARDGMTYQIAIPHSTWYGECQWRFNTLHELGYDPVNDFSVKRIALSNTGSWACAEHLPMGSFLQPSGTMTWQIETSASWCWEMSDLGEQLFLHISGPAWEENGFRKRLAKRQSFTSVPCAVAFSAEGFAGSIAELTNYRRRIRRPNSDNEHPSVIFNDYMNCLWGDPTTAKEIPLIDAACAAGCKYYCIDCGWYDDGPWWDGVGEWLPAKGRFPNGMEKLLHYIREKGMIPGLWLELEVMGIHCPMAEKVPDTWFFQLEGKRIIDESRYQLDYRNPAVIRYADIVIERLVREYGVGYIKMDYNINAGVGTEYAADSAGEGLLAHTRAYLTWLDGVFARYPELVIENCSSGGMRMEYSHLSRHSIQSVSDQTDYIKNACIACNCPTACTPEQAAIWSYPMANGDREETIFNMINGMLLRIHQSGHLAELSNDRLALVKEGIACHLSIVDKLKTGSPFWPIGIGSFGSEYLCLGIACGDQAYLAVWHTKATPKGELRIRLPGWKRAQCIYPKKAPVQFIWEGETLIITLHGVIARLWLLEK